MSNQIKSINMQEAYNIAKELSKQPGHTPHQGYLPLLLGNVRKAEDSDVIELNKARNKDYQIPNTKFYQYLKATMYINDNGTLIPIEEEIVFNLYTLHFAFSSIEAPTTEAWYRVYHMYQMYQDNTQRVIDACNVLLKAKEETECDAVIRICAKKSKATGEIYYEAKIESKKHREELIAKGQARYNQFVNGSLTPDQAAELMDLQRAKMASETLEKDQGKGTQISVPKATEEDKAAFAKRCAEAQRAMQDKLNKISK